MHYDLTKASVEDLARLVFDHPVVEDATADSRREWYWTEDFTLATEPAHQLALMSSLFANARELRGRFSAGQIEEGLWFMFGPGGAQWFAALLRDEHVPVQLRQRCISDIFHLYDQLLSRVQLETATYMLWDLLIDQFYIDDEHDHVVPIELEATMFDTLRRILALRNQECQRAALHGLGHLRHRDTRALVTDYLTRNAPLPDGLADYAGRVRDGQDVL